MSDKRIIKASEVLPGRQWAKGYIVDLSPADVVNPDFYWSFATKAQAEKFLELVQSGMDARRAEYVAKGYDAPI